MNYCRLFAEEVQPHEPALRAYKSDRLLVSFKTRASESAFIDVSCCSPMR